MYAANEATVQRAETLLAALQSERAGYEHRIEAVKRGVRASLGHDLGVEQLEDRIKQVDVEIKRVKKDIASSAASA